MARPAPVPPPSAAVVAHALPAACAAAALAAALRTTVYCLPAPAPPPPPPLPGPGPSPPAACLLAENEGPLPQDGATPSPVQGRPGGSSRKESGLNRTLEPDGGWVGGDVAVLGQFFFFKAEAKADVFFAKQMVVRSTPVVRFSVSGPWRECPPLTPPPL